MTDHRLLWPHDMTAIIIVIVVIVIVIVILYEKEGNSAKPPKNDCKDDNDSVKFRDLMEPEDG